MRHTFPGADRSRFVCIVLDAATVSYSEVVAIGEGASRCAITLGPPCRGGASVSRSIALRM